METRLQLYIKRVEDPREVTKVCPLAFEWHNFRREALHDIFDNQFYFRVDTWGDTDDEKQAHEAVTILITAIVTGVAGKVFDKAIEKIGEKLAEKVLDESASELVKWVIGKIFTKQKEKKIDYVHIVVNEKTAIEIDSNVNSKINIIINVSDPKAERIAINKV